jgi:WS/DGAT/MGAT family acyltransferase
VLLVAHHAMIDGVSNVDVILTLHDLTPDAPPAPPPPAPWQPQPLPDPLTLLQDAVRDNLVAAAERWTDQTFQRLRPAEAADRAQAIARALQASGPQMAQPAPRTRFNSRVSTKRNIAYASFPFADLRAIRTALGGTVNDVVLTIEAGALARYLRHHGDRTEGLELRAMCPVSMRAPDGRGAMGNQVSMMLAPLYVGIADPVERHNAERAAMERLKEQGQAAGFYAMTAQGDTIPAWQQAWAGQQDVENTMINTVSSNVPGPQVPLYLRGHKLERMIVGAMLSPNIGLFHGIFSYNQMVTIFATVDPEQMPDPWFYADCLHASFAELRDAAARVAATTGAPASSAPVAEALARRARPRRRREAAQGARA